MAVSEKLVRHQVEASDHSWTRLRILGLWIGLSLGLWTVIIGTLTWALKLIA